MLVGLVVDMELVMTVTVAIVSIAMMTEVVIVVKETGCDGGDHESHMLMMERL